MSNYRWWTPASYFSSYGKPGRIPVGQVQQLAARSPYYEAMVWTEANGSKVLGRYRTRAAAQDAVEQWHR